MNKPKDLKGKRVGKLVCVCIHSRDRNGHVRWVCACDCGGEHIVLQTHLSRGLITHCGCDPYRGSQHKQWKGHGEISGNIWNGVCRGANASKGRRKLEFSITIEEAWEIYIRQDRKCALSGLPIWFPHTTTQILQSKTASLDRIDSSKGYISGNIQWVHKDINKMKNSFDQNYFLDLCTKISEFNSGGQCEL